MAVKNAAGNGYLGFIAWAMTIQLSTREVVSSLGEMFSINGYGERGWHSDLSYLVKGEAGYRCSAKEDSLKGILKILKPFKVRSDVMFYLTVYTVLYL